MRSQPRSTQPNFGGRASEQDALEAVVRRVATAVDPQAIWLFGSRARGDARPDSDFDLLVVGKEGSALSSDDYEQVDRAINGLGVGCDLAPCSATDFAIGRQLKTSFVAQVIGEGRQVYVAP